MCRINNGPTQDSTSDLGVSAPSSKSARIYERHTADIEDAASGVSGVDVAFI